MTFTGEGGDVVNGRARVATRLVGVDAARGLALVGMIAVHVTPSVEPDGGTAAVHLLASGRAAALFALLAGVGLALASGGTSPPRGVSLRRMWRATAIRAVVLMCVGFGVGLLDSGVAVILVYYGALFIVALPFLGLRARTLFPLAAVWALVAPVVTHLLRLDVPPGPGSSPTFASLADPLALLSELFVTGYYPVIPWMAYMLAGLGVGRLALRTRRVAGWLFAGGAGLAALTYLLSWSLLHMGVMERLVEAGVGAHPTSRPFTDAVLDTSFYGTSPTTSWWWLTVVSPHTSTPFDLLHTIGTSAAVLGLALLVERWWRGALAPLAAMGSMTFTLYTLHVVLLATAIPGELDYSWLFHILVALAVAVPWRRHIGRGPLEALTASLARTVREPSSAGRRSLQ
ncbi:DUF1624 domain-containing protein [Actinobacteria bacterium YIM 96077]|uniref:Heparan-alpha-glucosaminide N-acetyltransferase catalytic domain-containing protein n=1 Tax=Phytoactinopolyspora halophila TaxID=1981511 RepID=A0A329R0V2_9ACTN|nr:heparan-alpha-glucosaminide N-acetyltransferase domain-containing protein [Phytoactinopolyspora halophila]AYY11759.1 DUF1624 domain-containing protein [Actinobacteria bacterium YIM 96077]RAW17806.1 hypothetical protein DPM12_02810 [Phytoactinopolyspora halophila]